MPKWKNISLEGYAYFITTKIKDYIKVFETKPYFDIIIDNVNFYREKFGFKLWGYVIMPEHIHLMIHLVIKMICQKSWRSSKDILLNKC